MKNLNRIFFTILFMFCVSCAPVMAPSVDFYNYSNENIIKIKGHWAGFSFLGATALLPGQGSAEGHYLENKSDIFITPIHLEWENAAKKKFSRDFTIDKSQFKFDRKHHYIGQSVVFFFTQDDVEIYISRSSPDRYMIQKREQREQELKLKKNKNKK